MNEAGKPRGIRELVPSGRFPVERASPKFAKTFCSQCGQEFGPGNHGFSHCSEHMGRITEIENITEIGNKPAPAPSDVWVELPDGRISPANGSNDSPDWRRFVEKEDYDALRAHAQELWDCYKLLHYAEQQAIKRAEAAEARERAARKNGLIEAAEIIEKRGQEYVDKWLDNEEMTDRAKAYGVEALAHAKVLRDAALRAGERT